MMKKIPPLVLLICITFFCFACYAPLPEYTLDDTGTSITLDGVQYQLMTDETYTVNGWDPQGTKQICVGKIIDSSDRLYFLESDLYKMRLRVHVPRGFFPSMEPVERVYLRTDMQLVEFKLKNIDSIHFVRYYRGKISYDNSIRNKDIIQKAYELFISTGVDITEISASGYYRDCSSFGYIEFRNDTLWNAGWDQSTLITAFPSGYYLDSSDHGFVLLDDGFLKELVGSEILSAPDYIAQDN